MAKLQIDLSGKGGLAPRFWGDTDRIIATPALRYLGNADQVANGIYNPLRRYGYMSPSNATFTAITFSGGTFDAMMGSSFYDGINDDFYFAERGRQLFKGDGLDDTELALSVDLGANNTIHDIEAYVVNNIRNLFVIYDKNGTMDISISVFPYDSGSDNTTWLTGTVSGAFGNTLTNDAFMRVADNGFAYLFQDNNIHKIDGTGNGGSDGTISPNVIQFPNYFQITDAIDYRGNMYVAIRQDNINIRGGESAIARNASVGVYVWDRLTSVVRTRDFFPLEGVKEIRNIYVSPEGDIRLLVVNSERITEILQFTGSTFKSIQEVGYRAYPIFVDGLTKFSKFTTWLGIDGNIYGHGKVSSNDKESLYKIGTLSDTIATSGASAGAILFGGANNDSSSNNEKSNKTGLYLSYVTGSTKTMKEWDIYGTGSDGVNAMAEQGDVYTLVKYLPQMSTVNYIDIYMAALSTSGSSTVATLKIYFNQSTTQWASKTVTRDDVSKGYIRIDIDKPYINSIQLETEFSSTTLGESDFAPSLAVVDYSPTTTKG